jgi:hypothetical protein
VDRRVRENERAEPFATTADNASCRRIPLDDLLPRDLADEVRRQLVERDWCGEEYPTFGLLVIERCDNEVWLGAQCWRTGENRAAPVPQKEACAAGCGSRASTLRNPVRICKREEKAGMRAVGALGQVPEAESLPPLARLFPRTPHGVPVDTHPAHRVAMVIRPRPHEIKAKTQIGIRGSAVSA